MLIRAVAASLLVVGLFAPAVILADTTVNPTQGSSSAASLGPAVTGATSTGASSADSSALQPAGSNPLQSSTGAASGLSAPTANALQAPASSTGALQVLQGEADGAPQQLASSSTWAWIWFALALLVVIALAAIVWRRRARIFRTPSETLPTEITNPVTSQTLTIQINRPPADVLNFTLDPANTPTWINTIAAEEATEQPAKVGTVYRNQNILGDWTEYEITEFEPDKHFVLAQLESPYRVKCTVSPTEDGVTDFEYHEWVESGELAALFPPEPLQKLKTILEIGGDAHEE